MDKKLLSATMKFNLACLNKLAEKEKEGWVGWDNPEGKDGFKSEIEEHWQVKRELTQDDLVDISNYCNFLWNLKELPKEAKLNE